MTEWNYNTLTKQMIKQLTAAVECYAKRTKGYEEPIGSENTDGNWMPDPDTEEQECCRIIVNTKPPPDMMRHCRTSTRHIANLHNINVDFFTKHTRNATKH